jgi:hypothetical protein
MLRLNPEGAQVVVDWLMYRCKSPGDGQLVADVLRAVASQTWRGHWYWEPAEQDVTSIQPREGLYVHVRLWTGEDSEFTVVSVTDIEPSAAGGDHA